MKYKAIITDIDGTITSNFIDAVPSEKVTMCLKKAKKKMHIGVATARSLKFASHLFDHLDLSGPSILLGGSQIVDAKTRQVLIQNVLSTDIVLEVIKTLRKTKRKFFIDEPHEKVAYSTHYIPVSPINIYIPNLTIQLADELHEILHQLPTVAINKATDWGNNKFALNIAHALSTKQGAVHKTAQILNISPSEIIGIGDGYNDFPLLMACGLKVAMGNAVAELKEIADYIAPPLEDDGVVDVIEKFVLS